MRYVVVGTETGLPYGEAMWVPIRCHKRLDEAHRWVRANNDRSLNEMRHVYLHLISTPSECGCGRFCCPVCQPENEWTPWYWESHVILAAYDSGVQEGLAHPRRPFDMDQISSKWSNDPWRYPMEWPLPELRMGESR